MSNEFDKLSKMNDAFSPSKNNDIQGTLPTGPIINSDGAETNNNFAAAVVQGNDRFNEKVSELATDKNARVHVVDLDLLHIYRERHLAMMTSKETVDLANALSTERVCDIIERITVSDAAKAKQLHSDLQAYAREYNVDPEVELLYPNISTVYPDDFSDITDAVVQPFYSGKHFIIGRGISADEFLKGQGIAIQMTTDPDNIGIAAIDIEGYTELPLIENPDNSAMPPNDESFVVQKSGVGKIPNSPLTASDIFNMKAYMSHTGLLTPSTGERSEVDFDTVRIIAYHVTKIVNTTLEMVRLAKAVCDINTTSNLDDILSTIVLDALKKLNVNQMYVDLMLDEASRSFLYAELDRHLAGVDINEIADLKEYNFGYGLTAIPVGSMENIRHTRFGEDTHLWTLARKFMYITKWGDVIPFSQLVDGGKQVRLPTKLLNQMCDSKPLEILLTETRSEDIIGAFNMSIYVYPEYGGIWIYHSQADKNAMFYAANTKLISKIYSLAGRGDIDEKDRNVDSMAYHLGGMELMFDHYVHLTQIKDVITRKFGRYDTHDPQQAMSYLNCISAGDDKTFLDLFDEEKNPILSKAMHQITECNRQQFIYNIACFFC